MSVGSFWRVVMRPMSGARICRPHVPEQFATALSAGPPSPEPVSCFPESPCGVTPRCQIVFRDFAIVIERTGSAPALAEET